MNLKGLTSVKEARSTQSLTGGFPPHRAGLQRLEGEIQVQFNLCVACAMHPYCSLPCDLYQDGSGTAYF